MMNDEASSQQSLLDEHAGSSWRGEEWMHDTWEHIKHLPITQVVLPGSHNAATSELTDDVAQDHGGNTIRTLHSYLGKPIGDLFARGWSVTQPHSVPEQLALGVRYLDLRVCVDPQLQLPAALRTCHGYFGPSLRSVLDHTKAFIAAHSHEFLLLDFNHLYSMTPAAHAASVELLRDAFGSLLLEEPELGLSLQALHDKQRRVLVAYHATVASRPRWLLQGHIVQSPWPNVPEASRLEERLQAILLQRRGGGGEGGQEAEGLKHGRGLETAGADVGMGGDSRRREVEMQRRRGGGATEGGAEGGPPRGGAASVFVLQGVVTEGPAEVVAGLASACLCGLWRDCGHTFFRPNNVRERAMLTTPAVMRVIHDQRHRRGLNVVLLDWIEDAQALQRIVALNTSLFSLPAQPILGNGAGRRVTEPEPGEQEQGAKHE